MAEVDVSFMGVLSNVDETILSVDLGENFYVTQYSSDVITGMISRFETDSIDYTKAKLKKLHCIYENYVYCIEKPLTIETEVSDGHIIGNTAQLTDFYIREYYRYLIPLIRKMRLYKEGNIWLPLKYFYYRPENHILKPLFRAATNFHISHSLYSLNREEIADFRDFISRIQIPFEKKFINLGFDNFEWSYHLQDINLQFLTLMIGLEALFNPGQSELKYRVSRNVAVLLGSSFEGSDTIFTKMKLLYDQRSKLVHNGELGDFSSEDLFILRDYLRKSILKMNDLNQNKDDILKLINSHGFGSM